MQLQKFTILKDVFAKIHSCKVATEPAYVPSPVLYKTLKT